MITPRFTLHQDDTFLKIEIRAPYCSLGELEVDCDGNKFYFYCKPYYLRLDLPGEIVNDDKMKVVFDTDTGKFTCSFTKLNKCENFADLDLITKFLALGIDSGDNGTMPVEPLSSGEQEDTPDADVKVDLLDKSQYGFGFALRANKDFVRISSEFDNVFEINPCETSMPERRKLRLQYEQGKFNADHYLADYCDDDDILELISLKCPYNTENDTLFKYSDEDYDFLKDLLNVEYNLSKDQIKICHNTLLDILFAFCYSERSTSFEGNVESDWTITKLAATLGWLDAFEDTKDVFISAFRRGLIYPLYRHFDFLQVVFDDLKALISLDEKCLVKILIKIYNIFLSAGSGAYVLNNLFIKDYIVYIMKWDKEMWRTTVSEVKSMTIKKEELGLNLEEIEKEFVHFQKLVPGAGTNSSDSDEDTSSEDTSDSSSSDEDSSDSETTTAEENPKEVSKCIVIQE